MSRGAQRIADLVEIERLCARYLAYASQFVPDEWLKVFSPDAEDSAFGTVYGADRMTQRLAGGYDSGRQHDPLADPKEGADAD